MNTPDSDIATTNRSLSHEKKTEDGVDGRTRATAESSRVIAVGKNGQEEWDVDQAHTRASVEKFQERNWLRNWWRFKFHLLEEDRFVTSYIATPKTLLLVRSMLTIYTIVTLACAFATYWDDGMFFRFFTNLSYMGLTIYMIAATVHSAIYVSQGAGGMPLSIIAQPRWLRLSFWMLYEVVVCFKVIVPIVYWAFLSKKAPAWSDSYKAWLNVSVHGFDFVVVFIEGVFNRHIMVLGHCWVLIAFMLLYAIATNIIYYANTANGWTYFFLNTTKISAVYWYPLLCLMMVLFWLLVTVAHVYREKHFMKKGVGKGGVVQTNITPLV